MLALICTLINTILFIHRTCTVNHILFLVHCVVDQKGVLSDWSIQLKSILQTRRCPLQSTAKFLCVWVCVHIYMYVCQFIVGRFFFFFCRKYSNWFGFTVFSFIDCGHCTTMPKLCAHLCHCVWCAINPRMGRFNAVWYDLASSPTLVSPFMPIVGLCVPKLTVLQTTDGKDKMLMGTGWNCVWQSWFLQRNNYHFLHNLGQTCEFNFTESCVPCVQQKCMPESEY